MSIWRFSVVATGYLWLACPAQAAGPFDGVYTSATLPTGSAQCAAPTTPFVLRVTDGTMVVRFHSFPAIEGPVGGDGSVSIVTPRTSLRGAIANAAFDGYLSFGNCQFHLQLPKR